MLLITARLSKPIRIGDMDVVLDQVRGVVARLVVTCPTSSPVPALLRLNRSGVLSEPTLPFVFIREGDELQIGEVTIVLSQIRGPQVRLAIDAPKHIRISTESLEAAAARKKGTPSCATSSV